MGKSMMWLCGELGKVMAENGIVEGEKEFKLFDGLVKELKGRGDWEKENGNVGEGREKKLGVMEIKRAVELRNRGVSYDKIGKEIGVVGMMVSNIMRGKIYKKEMEEVRKMGIELNR